ncbi:hypothetical protein D3C79_822430 [compost metagenome]
MVSDNFKRDILLNIIFISYTSKLSGFLNNRLEQIGIEVGIYILKNGCKTLQSSTGINVLVRKRRIAAILVMVEL